MKFTMDHRFDWPVEKVTGILKAGEDLFPMEELPNVSARKKIEQKRVGSKIIRKFEWCVHGEIPKIAQKILRPETLTFIEDTVWDDDTCAFESLITPHYFKNAMKCMSKSAWRAAGEGCTERHIESTVIISLPLIGPVVEKLIVENFKKNNEMSAVLIRKSLGKKFGPPSK